MSSRYHRAQVSVTALKEVSSRPSNVSLRVEVRSESDCHGCALLQCAKYHNAHNGFGRRISGSHIEPFSYLPFLSDPNRYSAIDETSLVQRKPPRLAR